MFSSTSAGCVPCKSTDYRTSFSSTAFDAWAAGVSFTGSGAAWTAAVSSLLSLSFNYPSTYCWLSSSTGSSCYPPSCASSAPWASAASTTSVWSASCPSARPSYSSPGPSSPSYLAINFYLKLIMVRKWNRIKYLQGWVGPYVCSLSLSAEP